MKFNNALSAMMAVEMANLFNDLPDSFRGRINLAMDENKPSTAVSCGSPYYIDWNDPIVEVFNSDVGSNNVTMYINQFKSAVTNIFSRIGAGFDVNNTGCHALCYLPMDYRGNFDRASVLTAVENNPHRFMLRSVKFPFAIGCSVYVYNGKIYTELSVDVGYYSLPEGFAKEIKGEWDTYVIPDGRKIVILDDDSKFKTSNTFANLLIEAKESCTKVFCVIEDDAIVKNEETDMPIRKYRNIEYNPFDGSVCIYNGDGDVYACINVKNIKAII